MKILHFVQDDIEEVQGDIEDVQDDIEDIQDDIEDIQDDILITYEQISRRYIGRNSGSAAGAEGL